MPIEATSVLGVIGVIVAMICIYIFVMPEKKYSTLTPFLKWLSDLFNFRTLWLESIVKFFYVLSTTICVVFGVLLIISVERTYWGGTLSLAGPGICILLFGPVVLRLIYEGSIMLILLVKNVMEINKTLKKDANAECNCEEAPVVQTTPACSSCGAPMSDDGATFCYNCGNKIR